MKRITAFAAAGAAALSLSACAEGNYPSIGNISKISDSSILSPQQREDAVKEMERQRDAQNDRAAKGN
jgi:hypothetical protein